MLLAGAMLSAFPAVAQVRPSAAARTAAGHLPTGQLPAGQLPAGQLSVPPIAYKMRRLANGLTVYTLRDTTTPNVQTSVWYDVGSKHDPDGRSGFAHLFEHILSRKTVNMPYNMINKLTEDVGGSRNASTWYDRTNYYEIVPAQYLETMLWTHAERMARPVVDEQVFETERNVVKEELRQRVLAPPYGRLFNFVLGENSFDTSPNRRPTIGSIADLDAATLADARAFHEAYYGPDTASLIVSGNFDEAQLQRWVDKYFAGIPARANKIPLAIAEHDRPRTSPRTVTAYAPNVPLPVVASTWKVPGSAHPDMAALQVLDAILSTGDSSRLHKALVYDKQIATAAGTNFNDIEDGGFLAPYAILAGGKTVPEAEAALAAEIAAVRTAPVSAAELAEAKNEILSQSLQQRETISGRASEFGEALVRTGDPRAADKRLAAVLKVTAADVQRVAAKYLAQNARVDIRYLNESERPAGQADMSGNPLPMPRFRSVPAAARTPNMLSPEGARQAPPAPGRPVPVTAPVIAETRLPTGLGVVTAKTSNVPLAGMALVIKGGTSTDPAGKAGLAGLTADLATRGTPTRSAQQIAAEMESLGATLSSGAGPDGLIVAVTAPTANLEAAGRIMADIVSHATFPQAEFDRERKRALDGLRVALKDPGGIASLVAPPVLYGAAPYGTVPSGTPTSIAALSRDDLAGFHRRWWHPGNSTLVISGGLDNRAAAALAGRLFGDWRGQGPVPQAPTARAGTPRPVRTVVIDLPGAGQAAVLAAVRGIDRSDPRYYDLVVANAVLGQGSNGRLFEEVRVKRALSYGAQSNHPARADDSMLTASAQTKNESAAEVVKVFLDEFDRLGREPLSAEAVDKRKLFIAGNYIRQAETGAGFGGVLANLIQQGLSPAEATRYLAAINAVDAGRASGVAGQLLSSKQATVIVVGDAAKFIEPLRALRPNVEVIRADQLDLGGAALRGM